MIFSKIREHLNQKLPFVIYQKPNSNQLVCFLSKNDKITSWDKEKKGFIFHPFQEGEIIFFEETNCKIVIENREVLKELHNNQEENSNISRENFEKLVEKSIKTIQQKKFDKVVVSSFETIDISNQNLESIFIKLTNFYPTAFCYWFYHPKIGMWMGATPELLLQKNENSIKTISLAGTQLYSDNISWKSKEKEEQKLVTIFIESILRKYCNQLTINQLNTKKAGNLAHLISEIEGVLNDDKSIYDLIQELHPTPAVCGLPKKVALEFIKNNENYSRQYYTGFLGEWNKNFETNLENQTQLFVNLRCMQIIENIAKIYVGCGITKDSIPENEYQEIVNKSRTMRGIL